MIVWRITNRFRLLAGITLMLLVGLRNVSAEETTLRFGYAYDDCAPWDGPALHLILQPHPYSIPSTNGLPQTAYPHYSIGIWNPAPPTERWIMLRGGHHPSDNGQISWCPAQGQCQPQQGKIRFSHISPNQLAGELILEGDRHFPFQVPVLPHAPLCG